MHFIKTLGIAVMAIATASANPLPEAEAEPTLILPSLWCKKWDSYKGCCVDDDKLEDELGKVLRALMNAGPLALAETKRLTRDAYHMSLDAGLNAEANAFAACFGEDEAQVGISAFLDKRSPNFTPA